VAFAGTRTDVHARLARKTLTAPPQAFFVGSAVFHYLGPAFAVLLFARVDPLGVAWLRIVSAAAIFAIWRRPWHALGGADRTARETVVGLAVVFAAMNACFYVAIDRLPLGTVAAIEFLPVIGLAALGARTPLNAGALGLAVSGVYLLTDVRLEGEPIGLAFAFANAALFAVYIVLAHRLARSPSLGRIDGLAAAMLLAAIVVTPLAGWSAAPAFPDPVAIAAGAGVGLASSVIPYVFDQLAMARLSRATYSLMVSLLPATATVVGIVVLRQIPTAIELAGVALVVAAVAVHRERPKGHVPTDREVLLGREHPRARFRMITRRRGALDGARQGRRERPYQADMGATEDAASRRPAWPGDMAAHSESRS
jgi:inner membrane transporter RhtA